MSTADVVAVTGLASAISLLCLVVLYFWLYQDYRIDLFRHHLFALRDELFDVARSGELSFDHPAYGLLRSLLNGFIRYGHRFGVVSVIWAANQMAENRLEQAGIKSFQGSWAEAVKGLDPAVHAKVNGILSRMHFVVADQLVLGSLVLTVLLVPVVLLKATELFGQSLLRFVRGMKLWNRLRAILIDPIDSAALVEGNC